MARSFSRQEAKSCLANTRDLINRLEQIRDLPDRLAQEVSDAAENLADLEVKHMLLDVPVEEINQGNQRFKTKYLRDHGYETVADLFGVSSAELADIKGISDEAAILICRQTEDMIRQTKSYVRLRLNYDDRSGEATNLVTALSKYRQEATIWQLLWRESGIGEKTDEMRVLADDLLAGNSGAIRWLFTSGDKKQRAEEAYHRLSELLDSEEVREARSRLNRIRQLENMSEEAAWKDFRENSIAYTNLLEDMVPNLAGAGDTEYGLPEDLVEGIQEEPLLTNGLTCSLRRYQEWGVKYILHQKRVLLGDEMGLGKTVQAIAAMVTLHNTGATHFLVVCPASVISNWCREIEKHSVLSVCRVHGKDREEMLVSWKKNGGVAVTTYETTAHIFLDTSFRFSMMVVDEAHYIKNPEAKRTINVKYISGHADRLLFMTGTALENRVGEMVGLMKILQPEVAGSVQSMTYLSSAPQFAEKIAPVYYRRRRKDVLTELPELIDTEAWCTMGRLEKAEYEIAVLEGNYAKARRVSWNIDDMEESSKAKRMMDIIDEAQEEGRKVIVFSFFLDTIQKVQSLLPGRCFGPINGSVPPARRQEIIDEFDQAESGSVLAAQIQAGGTGLNIQSASVVILCEPQFKPSTENQAISRAYRMGQTRNVLVYRLLCDDTIDERIIDMLRGKQEIFDAFADESKVGKESLKIDEKAAEETTQDTDILLETSQEHNTSEVEIDKIEATEIEEGKTETVEAAAGEAKTAETETAETAAGESESNIVAEISEQTFGAIMKEERRRIEEERKNAKSKTDAYF